MKLYILRKAMGLTQKQVAMLAGVSEAAICLYEKGERSPNLTTAKRLADALGVTVDELIGGGKNCRSAS